MSNYLVVFNKIERVDLAMMPVFRQSARGHRMTYSRQICRNSVRQDFLTNRAANNWNNLQAAAIDAINVEKFKSINDIALNDYEQVLNENRLS